MVNPMNRFEQARNLGSLALLRLRAAVLLEQGRLEPPLTFDERERLERIAVAPHYDDRDWLGGFDDRFVVEDDE